MNALIVGATGYGGLELIRIIQNHPYLNIHSIMSSSSHTGKSIESVFPHLSNFNFPTLTTMNFELSVEEVEVVFFATPSGISQKFIPQLLEKGIKCIDLSGGFRLKSPSVYEQWYKQPSVSQEYLKRSVYGLSEINRNAVEGATVVANPGCFPTAALLAIIPVLKEGWIDENSIIIDGKTGVSGAGRGVSLGTHFSETNENIKAYKLGNHQHIPEIEQVLSESIDQPINVTFSTHLVPMTRGVLCTIYMKLSETITLEMIASLYKKFYQNSPFVRIRTDGSYPTTKEVYASNYCDIGFALDDRTNQLIVVSVIDNLMKGAAGQAVQNINIMMGWEETTGLDLFPIFP